MMKTPKSHRTHITIFGKTNSGKSTLFNRFLNQDVAIVSPEKGTTTDPVRKSMELLPFGPILLTDTAGTMDFSTLSKERINKTLKELESTDFAIYVASAHEDYEADYAFFREQFEEYKTPHILVVNNFGKSSKNTIDVNNNSDIDKLKRDIISRLDKDNSNSLLSPLLDAGSTVVLVIPIDSEAPVGRLILPQVQLIRDALDHSISCFVCRDTELKETLKKLKKTPDLIVTDSQAFDYVSTVVQDDIPLTSFSILFAYNKSGLKEMIDGIKKIEDLSDGDKVLISETCSHNHSHEDIGMVKIPHIIKKISGKDIDFHFAMGTDFPQNMNDYSLIISCGGCMVNSKTIKSRVRISGIKNIPITNYGLIFSYHAGILDRSLEIFYKNNLL